MSLTFFYSIRIDIPLLRNLTDYWKLFLHSYDAVVVMLPLSVHEGWHIFRPLFSLKIKQKNFRRRYFWQKTFLDKWMAVSCYILTNETVRRSTVSCYCLTKINWLLVWKNICLIFCGGIFNNGLIFPLFI